MVLVGNTRASEMKHSYGDFNYMASRFQTAVEKMNVFVDSRTYVDVRMKHAEPLDLSCFIWRIGYFSSERRNRGTKNKRDICQSLVCKQQSCLVTGS